MTTGGYGKFSVMVYLAQGSRAVAQETVKGTHIYRFKVPAGNYTVATHAGSEPMNVVVHAAHLTRANIPSYCL